MKLTILGTRGEIVVSAPQHHDHSGVLVDDKILFDLGEEKFLERKPEAIFITHLHADHAIFARTEGIHVNVPVYAPEKKDFPFISVVVTPMDIDGYHISPIPTIHSGRVKSCAYLIEHNNKRILYTSDMISIAPEHLAILGKLDCVITEGSFMREGGMIRKNDDGSASGHQGIPDAVRMFKSYTNKIILTHFGSWFFKDIAKSHTDIAALGAENGRELLVAHDGMEVIV